MVKVNAPMLSLAASGSIAGALVFSSWKGRPYVRSLVKPANPKSGGQTGLRAYFKWLTQHWVGIQLADKNSWQDLADQLIASKFNGYMHANMIMARNFRAPSISSSRDETMTPAIITTFTATPGERQITITVGDDATGDGAEGYALFMSIAIGFAPAFDTMVALITANSGADVTFVHTPLEPGTYYYDVKPFTNYGTYGALSGEINGIVE